MMKRFFYWFGIVKRRASKLKTGKKVEVKGKLHIDDKYGISVEVDVDKLK